MKAEDRGNKKYPYNLEQSEKLKNIYRARVLKKYNITEKEMKLITTEGLSKNWPLPKY